MCHLKTTTATTTRKPERWHSHSHRVPQTHTPEHSTLPCIVSGRVWVWHYLAHSWLAIWALKSMLCESLPFISIIHVHEKARERERARKEKARILGKQMYICIQIYLKNFLHPAQQQQQLGERELTQCLVYATRDLLCRWPGSSTVTAI